MTKVYIGKSKINGKGIFAAKFIRKGEIIFILKGNIVNFIIRNKSKKEAASVGPNWFGIGENQWIDIKSLGKYINHSCNPNAGIKGKVTIVSLKNIKKDEEITFDYSISEYDMPWEMECGCGQKKCRKIIRSIQFLPYKIFKKYLPYIPDYFQKAYLEYHKIKTK